jgi:20S proteasome alpha/beta subunit
VFEIPSDLNLEISLMSLLVCFVGIDGVVLGTDSRGTFGDPRGITAQNDLIQKLYIANDRVGIMVAGAGDLGSTLVSGFLNLPTNASLGVTELTTSLHHYARKQFGEWFERFAIKPAGADSRPARPDLNFIVAGFDCDHKTKIFHLSSSLDFAPMLHNYGFGIDGIAQYALYLVSRLYDPGATMEDLQYLAAYVITETASQDGKVGGPIQLATIGVGMPQVLDASAVETIILANNERSRALKASFLTNQYKASRAARQASLSPALTGPFKATNSLIPLSVPAGGNNTTIDSRSAVEDESPERDFSGLAW